MVREKFTMRLTSEERDQLEHMVRAGKSSARVTTRARILLKTDDGWAAPKVAQVLDLAEGTVFRVKRRFAVKGVDKTCQWGGAKVCHQRSLASVNVRASCSGEVSQRQAGSRLSG